MGNDRPETRISDLKYRDMGGIALFVARAWATSIEVFIHRATGDRYMGAQALAVFVLVPVYASFWKGYDLRPVMGFMPVYLLACCVNSVQMAARRKRGERCHSYYSGWPRFLGPKAKVTELNMKRFWEPIITFLLGCCCRDWYNAPLGNYFMIGAVCMFVTVNVAEMATKMRSFDLNDATIEQEIIAERFREMRGERW